MTDNDDTHSEQRSVPVVPDTVHAGPRFPDAYDQVKHTKSAALWSGLVVGAILLLVLLVFIIQNTTSSQIKLLFWQVNLPLGVALLIAAILGALLVGLASGIRIVQLRRAAKKLQ
ncbi:LapA family protein [Tsukamurella soli]|uniref:DUF1049 domain-containing protein n=1 Tax=Tsukamurella soli TaxID=644556 RepID=A0ABP8JEG8_9ACTN